MRRRTKLQRAACFFVHRGMLSSDVLLSFDRLVRWICAMCVCWGALLATGCASLFGDRAARQDLLFPFDAAAGYVVLQAAHMRAVIQPDENAAVVVTTQDGTDPLRMELPVGKRTAMPADVYADRLLIGVSGALDVAPAAWRVVEQNTSRYVFQRDVRLRGIREGVFSLSVQREVYLHGRAALDGFMLAALPADVQVSGYVSRTSFTNPGPLPWPRTAALPHIRTEGDLQRGTDSLLFLHVRPGGKDAVAQRFGTHASFVEAVFVGQLAQAEEGRVVLPSAFVLPRIALLDREKRILTLIAYTPSMGALAVEDGDVMRPDPEILVSDAGRDRRWIRVSTSAAALPLATGGSSRHHRQVFHVRGSLDALLEIAAAFCRLPYDDVLLALEKMDLKERE